MRGLSKKQNTVLKEVRSAGDIAIMDLVEACEPLNFNGVLHAIEGLQDRDLAKVYHGGGDRWAENYRVMVMA